MYIKYTKEILEKAAKGSISVMQVLRKLGLKEAGGTHTHISQLIKKFNIDTSNFLGQRHARGKISCHKRKWQTVLIKRKSGIRTKAYILRRALIESGRKYICELCKLNPIWNEKELRFHVDHKNDNWLDDRKENLRFCCPNCHSQTIGFSGSMGLTDITSEARYYRERRKNKRLHSSIGRASGS